MGSGSEPSSGVTAARGVPIVCARRGYERVLQRADVAAERGREEIGVGYRWDSAPKLTAKVHAQLGGPLAAANGSSALGSEVDGARVRGPGREELSDAFYPADPPTRGLVPHGPTHSESA